MYCTSCGKQVTDKAAFCSYCGSQVKKDHLSINPQPTNHVGYSPKINDPAFDAYLANTKKYGRQFSVGIALVAVVGFGLYGLLSDDMEFLSALLIGGGLGGAYLVWAMIATGKKGKQDDWDGVVIDKKKKQKTRSQGSEDDGFIETYMVYSVIIRKENGKKYTLSHEKTDQVYNYYEVGDKVRFHGKLNSLEKHDKSRDSILFCNACATMNKIEDDVCFRCGCPLLK